MKILEFCKYWWESTVIPILQKRNWNGFENWDLQVIHIHWEKKAKETFILVLLKYWFLPLNSSSYLTFWMVTPLQDDGSSVKIKLCWANWAQGNPERQIQKNRGMDEKLKFHQPRNLPAGCDLCGDVHLSQKHCNTPLLKEPLKKHMAQENEEVSWLKSSKDCLKKINLDHLFCE